MTMAFFWVQTTIRNQSGDYIKLQVVQLCDVSPREPEA
jgi:hypothetical protein